MHLGTYASQAMLASQAGRTHHASSGAALGGGCHDLTIPVSVTRTSSHEFTLKEPYSIKILHALAAKEVLISNDYEISARLCLPSESSRKAEHDQTIQILVHGATFNKKMWDVDYKPETYNYVRRMNKEGYATLALDLVGAGNSTFPDGLLEAQTQTYVEVMHKVLQAVRAGHVGGRSWDHLVFVGFSIGGITANSLSTQYPDDADALVLHGIAWDLSWIYPAFLAGLQGPAAQIDPVKWGNLSPLYQTQSTKESRLVACFAGKYEPEMAEWDWNSRDFDCLGAAITFTYHLVEAPNYKGPVFLGIGRDDSTFCGGVKCRYQPWGLYEKYPNAKTHEVRVYEDTGHVIMYHPTAKDLMTDTVAFLRANGI